MYQAAVVEFPFVADLTVRQKGRVAKLWDHLAELRKVVEEKGMVIPQHMAANLLDLSKQRIGQLVDDGRLESIEMHGVRYVTEESVVAFAKEERRNGRPPKSLDMSKRELFKLSVQTARTGYKNTSK